MKKLINNPSSYVDEALEGFCEAFGAYRRMGRTNRVIARASGERRGKVGVVTGGGFGHLPLFAGYVGGGLLSACAVGEVFAGPPASVCLETLQAADGGAGVVCVLGNYGGDRMSFASACDEFEETGSTTQTVIITDDVASAPVEERDKRRGVAGMVFGFKTAGASAERGDSLAAVSAIASRTAQRTRSIGVAMAPCYIPGANAPGFNVSDGSIAIGMGIHGEPGLEERPLPSADQIAKDLISRLLTDAATPSGRVAILVNSLGATSLEELLIVSRAAGKALANEGVEVVHRYVGHYVTSMEMAGCSISVLFLDDEIEDLLLAPSNCPFWPPGR